MSVKSSRLDVAGSIRSPAPYLFRHLEKFSSPYTGIGSVWVAFFCHSGTAAIFYNQSNWSKRCADRTAATLKGMLIFIKCQRSIR